MAASRRTVIDVLKVVRKHVDQQTLRKIIADLRKIEGNASFRATIEAMHKLSHRKPNK